jgi:hypothetical protein
MPIEMKIKNQIPPMTNDLGAYWEQPKANEILIDDTHAVMSTKTFNALKQYNCSMPSGVYEGKMWCYDSSFYHGGKECFLRWYDFSEIGPGYVSNEQRIIILCD